MNSAVFQYFEKGAYYAHSALPQVHVSLEQVRNCIEKLGTALQPKHNSELRHSFELGRKSLKGLEDVEAYLVLEHELNHFVQIMSTPCGLLMWRLYLAITSCIRSITDKLYDSPLDYNFYLPIGDWYHSIGIRKIRDSPPHVPEALKPYIESGEYRTVIASVLAEWFSELDILINFVIAFEGLANLSMREFVKLANAAFSWLGKRSELPIAVNWDAHNLSAPSYLPQPDFTFVEIIEAAARLREFQILKILRANQRVLSDWKEKAIFGQYQRVFNWLEREIADSSLSRIAIDISMTSPIDIITGDAVDGVIYVEDVLPSWRLLKIVEAMRNVFWNTDWERAKYNPTVEIAKMAGIPTPVAAIRATVNKALSGRTAYESSQILYGVEPVLQTAEYYRKMESEFHRAFRIRNSNNQALFDLDNLFRPAIIFYEDIAVFSHRWDPNEENLLLFQKIFYEIVFNTAAMALLSDGNVSSLVKLQRSNRQTLARIFEMKPADLRDFGYEDVRDILQRVLNPAIFGLLKWSL